MTTETQFKKCDGCARALCSKVAQCYLSQDWACAIKHPPIKPRAVSVWQDPKPDFLVTLDVGEESDV